MPELPACPPSTAWRCTESSCGCWGRPGWSINLKTGWVFFPLSNYKYWKQRIKHVFLGAEWRYYARWKSKNVVFFQCKSSWLISATKKIFLWDHKNHPKLKAAVDKENKEQFAHEEETRPEKYREAEDTDLPEQELATQPCEERDISVTWNTTGRATKTVFQSGSVKQSTELLFACCLKMATSALHTW